MTLPRQAKWALFIVGALVLLAVIAIAAMHFAARSLKDNVLAALGPESELTDLTVGFTSIVITGVRVPGPKGWPAKDALRAERVVIQPDLRQLLSREIYINYVRVENAYISAVRPKEGGGLKILPGIMDKVRKKDTGTPRHAAQIAEVELDNCTIELFDQTISSKQKMRVDAVQGTVTDIQAPSMEGRSKLDLKGLIKGPAHQGTIGVAGWVEIAKKRSETTTTVRNVDLSLFEPYLIQKAKAGIDQGTFNLDLKASVRNNVITAPGTLTLDGLKLEAGEGAFSELSNVPRRAVLAGLADENDRIALEFELKGDLDNPGFSLGQGLGLKLGTALLKGFGFGFEGLIRAFLVLIRTFGAIPGAFAGA